MTCKDCVHYCLCEPNSGAYGSKLYKSKAEVKCSKFKDKSKIIELPCRVGDKIYIVPSETNYKLNILQRMPQLNKVFAPTVYGITTYDNKEYGIIAAGGAVETTSQLFGETWFLTKEEAEQRLKELEK